MSEDLNPAVKLIKDGEGCQLKTYLDVGGIPTIGWGHTGPDVTEGLVITQAQADAMLTQDINDAVTKVKALVKVPISNNELCALTSFTFNLGSGALGRSTLLRKLNGGLAKSLVADQFPRWVYVKGVLISGLVTRRKSEATLFLTPDGAPAVTPSVPNGGMTITIVNGKVRIEIPTTIVVEEDADKVLALLRPFIKIGV